MGIQAMYFVYRECNRKPSIGLAINNFTAYLYALTLASSNENPFNGNIYRPWILFKRDISQPKVCMFAVD